MCVCDVRRHHRIWLAHKTRPHTPVWSLIVAGRCDTLRAVWRRRERVKVCADIFPGIGHAGRMQGVDFETHVHTRPDQSSPIPPRRCCRRSRRRWTLRRPAALNECVDSIIYRTVNTHTHRSARGHQAHNGNLPCNVHACALKFIY